jgi:predicted nucleotidyltransferase
MLIYRGKMVTKPLQILFPDFREMLYALSEAKVEFLLVGAHAVGIHGITRATEDIDFFVRPSSENAVRLWHALTMFGAPLSELSLDDFTTPDVVYQVGVPPVRIDIMTSISGVDFVTAWANRVEMQYDGLIIPVIGLKELIANKAASGRPKDAIDLKLLKDASSE